MSKVPGNSLIKNSLADMTRTLNAEFKTLVERVAPTILLAADENGDLDPARERDTKDRVGDTVQRMFVGSDMRNAYGRDGITPQAPYPRILNEYYALVTGRAVEYHYNWLKKRPDDVFAFLQDTRELPQAESRRGGVRVRENEFLRRDGESLEAYLERLDDLRIFRPNPLAELDPNRRWVPMHQWQDPNGYRLSDRVWHAGTRTRAKIDRMIAEAFREGWSATRLANELERFLLPNRANLRTNRPYGVDASYDAMRLARSEIARAANHASYISSYVNPYVDRIDVARSLNGDPKCQVCPRHATLGIGGGRLRPPYSIHAANIPIYHPHCKCRVQPVVTDNPAEVTRRLRGVMQDAERELLRPVMNPADMRGFIERLVGRGMMDVVAQVMQLPLMP